MRRSALPIIAVLAALAASPPAGAATRTVTFDDLPPGMTVGDQYATSHGVRFAGEGDFGFKPVVRSAPGQAHSGDRVADIATCVTGCGEGFFTPSTRGRFELRSATAVSARFGYLGSDGQSTQVRLRAFDAQDQLIAETPFTTVTQGQPFTTKLEVTGRASGKIAYVDLVGSEGDSKQIAFDDLVIVTPDDPPAPDFALAPGQGLVDVLTGDSNAVPIDLSRLNGSDGDVRFTVSGLPPGMTASFDPNPVTGKGTRTTMTLSADRGASAFDDYRPITITATPAAGAGSAPRTLTKQVRIRQNCTRTLRAEYIDARSDGCLNRDRTTYVSFNNELRVNGLILKPLDGDRTITIDPGEKTIKATRAVYSVAIDSSPDIPVHVGPINWDFKKAGGGPAKVSGFVGTSFKRLKGLPVTSIEAFFMPDGRTQVTPSLRLGFWPFNHFGTITATTNLLTGNDGGADFTSLTVNVPKVSVIALDLTDVFLQWQQGDNWDGRATVSPKFMKGRTLTAGFGIRNGGFGYLTASVNGINVPIGLGVYLQSLGFEVHRSPLTLRGTISVSAGPAVAGKRLLVVNGGLTFVLADPWSVQVDGSANLAERFNLASAHMRYTSNGLFEFGAAVNWDLRLVYMEGSVSGWWTGGKDLLLEGSARGCVRIKYVPDPCARAAAIGSRVGIAGCVSAYGHGAGAGYKWGKGFETFWGCDLGPYRTTASPRGADGNVRRFTVPSGQSAVAWAVQGEGDAPGLTVSGPGGRTLTVSRAAPVAQRDGISAALGEDNVTQVRVTRPAAGTWTLTGDGTTPIRSVSQAFGLPAPQVRAGVSGRGRSRVLSWTLRPIVGQRVLFSEEGRDVRRVIATSSARRGSVRFTPADGPAGRRRIVALVEQNGLPRARITLGSYAAPAPLAPGRPRDLRLVRRGTRLVVRWTPRPAVFRHAVHVQLSDGRRTAQVLPAGRRTLTVKGVGRRVRAIVVVTGLTEANGKGPAARATSPAAGRS